MKIDYLQYSAELASLMETVRTLLADIDLVDRKSLEARLSDALERVHADGALRIAVVGEFNAGKSSLIRALTGADVPIDADVCTSGVTEHYWQGVYLMDTPGVQAEAGETAHDRIARQATVDADLVLFVATNELFNARLASYLHFILDADGLNLAGKTILVVNKMDRESNPEVNLLSEIQKVLGPHQDVPICFCAGSKWIQSETAPDEIKARFRRQSRLDDLAAHINKFIEDAGTLARLEAPLRTVEDVADEIQAALVSEGDEREGLARIRRQKIIVQGLQRRVTELRDSAKREVFSVVLSHGEPVANAIDESMQENDIKALFEAEVKQAIPDIETVRESVERDLQEAWQEAQSKLGEVVALSPLPELDGRRTQPDRVSPRVGATKPGSGFFLPPNASTAIERLLKDTSKGYGSAAAKAGEKAASGTEWLSKGAPYFAVAISFYQSYQEEKAKEKKARYLAQLRIALRNAFADQAKNEVDTLTTDLAWSAGKPLDVALTKLDAEAYVITNTNTLRATQAQIIADLKERCTRLQARLSGVS